MEKRADWIKEIYVDQADNSNKLKAQYSSHICENRDKLYDYQEEVR